MGADGHVPPQGVQEVGRRALRWIEKGKAGSGFTDVGRRRARQLADGATLSDGGVEKMQSYVARHDVDKHAEGFERVEEAFPSAGRVAWDAWSGDAGRRWVGGIEL